MSTTGFYTLISDVSTDLIDIFQPYSSGTNQDTKYITNMNGYHQDLSGIFQPYDSTNYPDAPVTGFNYTPSSGTGTAKDLNKLFAGKTPFTITNNGIPYNYYYQEIFL